MNLNTHSKSNHPSNQTCVICSLLLIVQLLSFSARQAIGTSSCLYPSILKSSGSLGIIALRVLFSWHEAVMKLVVYLCLLEGISHRIHDPYYLFPTCIGIASLAFFQLDTCEMKCYYYVMLLLCNVMLL